MNSCIYSSIVALGVAVSAIGTTTAQAANRFGVVCVHNKTTVPINFQVKWADVKFDGTKINFRLVRVCGSRTSTTNRTKTSPLDF